MVFMLVNSSLNLKTGRTERKLKRRNKQANSQVIFYDKMIKMSDDNANYWKKQIEYYTKKKNDNKKMGGRYDKLITLVTKYYNDALKRKQYWQAERDKTSFKGKPSPKPTPQETKAANDKVFSTQKDPKGGDGDVTAKTEIMEVKSEENKEKIPVDTNVEDFNMKGNEGSNNLYCISMVRLASGKMFSFFMTNASKVVVRVRDQGKWGPLVDVGSGLKNCPTAVLASDESRIDVFAVDSSNGQISTTTLTKAANYVPSNSKWTALPQGNFLFQQAATYPTTDPTVRALPVPITGPAAVNAKGTLHVFALGSDKKVYRSSFVKNAWSTWAGVGGNFLYGICASTNSNGRIDVFGVGSDNQVYYSSSADGNSYSAWANIGGTINAVSTPASVTMNNGSIHLLVVNEDGQMFYKKSDGKKWTDEYENMGGWTTSQPSMVLVSQTQFAYFKRSWNNDLWGRDNQSDVWSAWTSFA